MLIGFRDTMTSNTHACPNHLILVAAFLLLLSSFRGQLLAQDWVFTFDPEQTRVVYTLGDILHTVQGTFRMKSGFIKFDPATGGAQGLVIVDATSGKSGSDGRDQRMHKDILESQRYREITFVPDHVQGQIDSQHESQLEIQGVLTLHGTEHPVIVIARINPGGDQLNATTRFDIPYVKWGLKNPSSFILRVSSTVAIDIHAVGRLIDASANR